LLRVPVNGEHEAEAAVRKVGVQRKRLPKFRHGFLVATCPVQYPRQLAMSLSGTMVRNHGLLSNAQGLVEDRWLMELFRNALAPSEQVSLRQRSHGGLVVGVDTERLAQQAARFYEMVQPGFTRALVDLLEFRLRLQIEIVGGRGPRPPVQNPTDLGLRHVGYQRRGNALCQLILSRRKARGLALVRLRPQLRTRPRIYQSSCNAHAIDCPRDGAFDHIPHP